MSVKVAVFKNPPPGELYACSVLAVQNWAKGLADLRIEFGKRRRFQLDPRCSQRPKIAGTIIVSAWVDRQFKPALIFYPLPASQYPETVQKEFLERILADLKKWLEDRLAREETEMVGAEMMLVELNRGVLVEHPLRYF